MKIYLAGERDIFQADGGTFAWAKDFDYAGKMQAVVKRRLFSFYYHGFSGGKGGGSGKVLANGLSPDVHHTASAGMDMFLDSGAFTAFTQKQEIPIPEYAEYVIKHKAIWSTCSSLDAIGRGDEAAQKSYDNFMALRKLGAQVQPVWHVREPVSWLLRYVKEGWDYIFIGGMVPETTKWLMERLDDVWAQLVDRDGRALVKTHGFGLTDQKLMFRYPWYSIDSTSWLMTGVFGACIFRLPDGRLRKVVMSEDSPQARNFRGWHYKALRPAERAQVDKWLEPFGVTAEQCGKHYGYRDVINAATFQSLEDLATERYIVEQSALFG